VATPFTDGTQHVKKAAELGWKGQLETMALAGGTWQTPALGKQTQVCLGFRMRTVGKRGVWIIPSIAMVSVKSADGVELLSKETGETVPVDAPQMRLPTVGHARSGDTLFLLPEFQLVTIPAILFQDSKTLTLAWADGFGKVWRIGNLKPGRYTVRYVIRTEKGSGSQDGSFWLGEIQPQPVMVEIKE
jgi:hypothetical protein